MNVQVLQLGGPSPVSLITPVQVPAQVLAPAVGDPVLATLASVGWMQPPQTGNTNANGVVFATRTVVTSPKKSGSPPSEYLSDDRVNYN